MAGASHKLIGGPCFLPALGLVWRAQGALCCPVKAKHSAGPPLLSLLLPQFFGSPQWHLSGAAGEGAQQPQVSFGLAGVLDIR